MQNDMHTRAMLVSLRLSAWSARKYDRKVSEETAAAHNTTIEAGRYNKHLLPGDAPSYKALNSHISAMREIHYSNTLAWSDDGWRLLPVRNYQKYTDAMRAAHLEYNRLLDSFVDDYPQLRQEARAKLNGMYSDTDYPSNVRARYAYGLEFNPVPQGSDFRVTLTADEIAVITARTEERVKEAFETAHKDAVTRLYEVVASIHDRLTGQRVTKERTTASGKVIPGGEVKDATFRDSLITNARELCDVLTRLNVSEDMTLEHFRAQTEALAVADPETLRTDATARQTTAAAAQNILDAMKATYGSEVIA